MESDQIKTDRSHDLINNKKIFHSEKFSNINYIYHHEYCLASQNKWFKGSRERCLRSDMVA